MIGVSTYLKWLFWNVVDHKIDRTKLNKVPNDELDYGRILFWKTRVYWSTKRLWHYNIIIIYTEPSGVKIKNELDFRLVKFVLIGK
jgi:hypothetical protein